MNQEEREHQIEELVGAKIGETDAIARLIQEHHNPLDIAFGRELPPETTEGGGGGGMKPGGLRGFGFTEEAVAIPGSLSGTKIKGVDSLRIKELERIIGNPIQEAAIEKLARQGRNRKILENMPMYADGNMRPDEFDEGGPGSGPRKGGGRKDDDPQGLQSHYGGEDNRDANVHMMLVDVMDAGEDGVESSLLSLLNNEQVNQESPESLEDYANSLEQDAQGSQGILNAVQALRQMATMKYNQG